MPNFVDDFRLSVTRALRDQLLTTLQALVPAPLAEDQLAQVSRRGGVYQLFHSGTLVYVGKSTNNLSGRLTQHLTKISGREGALQTEMSFRCVYVIEDLDSLAPEKMLIAELRGSGAAQWNTNGFGNKDPGRNRDTSLVEADHFDRRFPIDLGIQLRIDSEHLASLESVMQTIKRSLPYNFRFDANRPIRTMLRQIPFQNPPANGTATVDEWFALIAGQLPDDWSVVALPGYVVAYPSLDPARCASRLGHWAVDEDDRASFIPNTPQFSSKAVELVE